MPFAVFGASQRPTGHYPASKTLHGVTPYHRALQLLRRREYSGCVPCSAAATHARECRTLVRRSLAPHACT
eukprot:scaffold593_cov382-Prasinococcus_capsulatus_cf.AAC.6